MEKYEFKKYINLLEYNSLIVSHSLSTSLLNTIIENVCYDSNKVVPNTLFVCKGAKFKKQYLEDAIKAGCIAYISEVDYEITSDIPCILVSNIYKTLALVSNLYFNYPSKDIITVGITGTKGKSTTAYYIKSILDHYQKEIDNTDTAIFSSIDTYDGITKKESLLTTQESLELQEHIRNAVDSNLKHVVMEVSSQALKYNRVYGMTYDVGVFLNISEDHISAIEHPNLEDYFSSKLKLFKQTKIACVNLNSDYTDRILEASKQSQNVITFGTMKEADVYGYDIRKDGLNTHFRVRTPYFDDEIVLTMPGLFNVENALAAIAIAVSQNIPYKFIYEGLKVARSSGRMEVYTNKDEDIVVIVDYAHNKLSFEKLYESTHQEYPERKIVTVFGCPGGKAQLRRKDLGTLAGINSDISYLTAEDPGIEDTISICKEISAYIERENGKYKIVEDRGEAIKRAILENPHSVILITGKGNETRQKYGTKYVKCLTDVQYAKKYLKEYDEKIQQS